MTTRPENLIKDYRRLCLLRLDQRRAELCGNDSQRYFHYDRENIRHTHHRPSASGYHRCIYHQVQTKSPIKEIMNIVTKTIGNIDYKVEDENILLIYSPLNKKGGR